VRIEKAKHLLLNPHLRVSEIAHDVGFQSLTHSNRVFRQMVGQSPSEYRESKSVRQIGRKSQGCSLRWTLLLFCAII
jgi:AraC-like DNA-binding protein